MKRKATVIVILCAVLLLGIGLSAAAYRRVDRSFSGKRAFKHAMTQVAFGSRPVGSDANLRTSEYIQKTLERNGWEVEIQEFAYLGQRVRNVVGKKGEGPLVILGAHYDTRPQADNDPIDRSQPVMGANDGASGVAVLLELARVLDPAATDQAEIWLVFFDAEDRGNLNGWPWCVGSQYFAERLPQRPEYVVVVDMIGDDDQQIYYEWTSSLWLQERMWGIAEDLGYSQWFIPQHRHSILDDHTSFLQWSLPAAVMIDFDYPYWHTRYDTLDKISADSLQRVGDVLEALLEGEPFAESPTVEPGS
ncbi:MAG: M28 family peptidase [Anaerolineae bacterium]